MEGGGGGWRGGGGPLQDGRRDKGCYLTGFYASDAADVRSALQIIMICPIGFQIRSELKREKTHWQIGLTKRTRSEGGGGSPACA